MSEASEAPVPAVAAADDGGKQNPLAFNLVVISPSHGVNGPLHFPNVAATTSVKDVKAKIRDTLPSKPTDEGQRLIHYGRLLSRETETMLEVFGQDALGNGDTKTLHLVLQDPLTATSPSSAPQGAPTPMPQLQPRPQSTPATPHQGIPGQQPLPGFQHMQQYQALHQAENTQQFMSHRLAQLQQETRNLHQEMLAFEQRSRAVAVAAQQSLHQNRQFVTQRGALPPHLIPASVQNLIAQQQRDIAADGRQGAQDTGGVLTPAGPQPLSGRASPNLHRPGGTTTYTREGIGPNGERWRMEVNETNVTLPIGQPHSHHHHQPGQPVNQHPALDQLQAILRNADRFLPAQNLQNNQNNMERAVSNPLPARVPTPAGVSSDTPAGTATPATTNNSPTASNVANLPNADIPAVPTTSHAFNAPIVGHVDPVVYLLSSPTGPRALLLNNSDTFYTPRPSSRRRRHDEHISARSAWRNPGADQNNQPAPVGLPEFRNRQRGARRVHRNLQENNNPLEQANPAAPHGNPGAGALAAQIGPMIWLIVRLMGFVWFFTAGNPSWSRWLMVSGLAVLVFIINTGIFNGIFEQLWGPIRRHVEALIPLAGPEAAQVPAINAAIPRVQNAAERQAQADGVAPPQPQEQGRRRGELDPAQVAAHLLEQHRQRNALGWLMTQIRRAEHAMLLFLASLVPGVGERHIAAREAEANAAEAERQRRIDAAAAAENPPAATETSAQATSTAGQDASADSARAEQPVSERANREAALVGNAEVAADPHTDYEAMTPDAQLRQFADYRRGGPVEGNAELMELYRRRRERGEVLRMPPGIWEGVDDEDGEGEGIQ